MTAGREGSKKSEPWYIVHKESGDYFCRWNAQGEPMFGRRGMFGTLPTGYIRFPRKTQAQTYVEAYPDLPLSIRLER